MVAATEENLVETGADSTETFVADTGYWSIDNATLDIDADVLITPMPLTGGITGPGDPRLARRREVIERLDAGEVTVTAAAAEMGCQQPRPASSCGIIALAARIRSRSAER